MIVNNATQLQALFTAFVAHLQTMFTGTPTFLDKLATTTTTTTEIVRFPWMGRLPTVRKWIDERKEVGAALKFLDVTPELFELTVGLDKNKIDDDQFGFFSSNILPQMAMQAAKWPDYDLIDFIRSNPNWSDGVAFFANNHPINVDDPSIKGFDGNATYANDYTTTPLTLDNVAKVRQAMMNLVGEDGKSLEIVPNLLVYEASNEQTANHILKSEYIAPSAYGNQTSQVGMVSNTMKGMFEGLMLQPLGADPGTWYLADTTKPVKPFGWLLREAWSFAQRIDPRDPVVFDKNKYLIGGRGRGKAYGNFPFLVSRAAA